MDEYKTDYLEAAAEEAERFREAAMILAERAAYQRKKPYTAFKKRCRSYGTKSRPLRTH